MTAQSNTFAILGLASPSLSLIAPSGYNMDGKSVYHKIGLQNNTIASSVVMRCRDFFFFFDFFVFKNEISGCANGTGVVDSSFVDR